MSIRRVSDKSVEGTKSQAPTSVHVTGDSYRPDQEISRYQYGAYGELGLKKSASHWRWLSSRLRSRSILA